jgi:hypothetical protein
MAIGGSFWRRASAAGVAFGLLLGAAGVSAQAASAREPALSGQWILSARLAPAFVASTTGSRAPAEARPVPPAQRAAIIKDLYRDRPEDRPPYQCFALYSSARDPRWILFDESEYAFTHTQYCPVSDAWSYLRKVGSRWEFLEWSGSSLDECRDRNRGLSAEGMPKLVIRDFNRIYGCMR